jgi:hypothetical protein
MLKCRLRLVEIITFVCGFLGSIIGEIFAMDESFRKEERCHLVFTRWAFGSSAFS